MERITSFCVDHRFLKKGVYISRIDGNIITYDLRFSTPNSGEVLTNSEMHTTEHMLATFLRNSENKDDIIYFGPMGCQTGFYLLVRDNVTKDRVMELIRDALEKTVNHNGGVFGCSEEECGNYRTLNLDSAKKACSGFLSVILENGKVLTYNEAMELYK